VRAQLGAEQQRLATSPLPPSSVRWPFFSGAAVVAVVAGGWLATSHLHRAEPAVAYPAPVPRHEIAPLPPTQVVVAPTTGEASSPTERPPAPAAPPRAAAPRHAPSRSGIPRGQRVAAPPAGAPEVRAQADETPADSLAREAALIETARSRVHAHPADALKVLEIHRREFPAGQLGAEREFLAVSALVQLGRGAEAEVRGQRLVSQYPGTTYAQRIPALLARPLAK
jgi:hypothetical protein